MFRKICIFMAFFGTVCVAEASEKLNQIVTSEVFYDSGEYSRQEIVQDSVDDVEYTEPVRDVRNVPSWPIAGSDADVKVMCGDSGCKNNGLVIENNVNFSGTGWSGGPDFSNGMMIPAGFDYECANDAEMPLMNREMMEDDGGTVLAMSRSGRKHCNKKPDNYAVFAEKAGFKPSCDKEIAVDSDDKSVAVNSNVEQEAPAKVQDQVRSWVVTNGQTLREVLKSWCDKEGWDLVWATSREYPIEASAVFKGRFVDVASALIRNFERATPIPYAKFYKGNRVIVVSTNEE